MTSAFKRIFRRLSIKLSSTLHTSAPRNHEPSSLKSCLLPPRGCVKPHVSRKVSIIGAAGNVGIAVALALWHKNICDEIILYDINADKVKGQALDMLHGEVYIQCPKVKIAQKYEDTCNSNVIITTLGTATTKAGQSRLELLAPNVKIYKDMIPKLARLSKQAVFIVLTNPVDIMAYFTWQFSGFEPNQVVGTGCELDTARFRHSIAKRFKINPKSVEAYVIGEHGDSSVPVWSTVAISGTRLRDFQPSVAQPCDRDKWSVCHEEVLNGSQTVRYLKKYTNWAIGLTAMNIARAVLRNARTIHCCSVHCKGMHGINSDIFLSVPSVIGASGCENLLNMQFDDIEKCALLKGEKLLLDMKNSIIIK